jgi:hypothetical protein
VGVPLAVNALNTVALVVMAPAAGDRAGVLAAIVAIAAAATSPRTTLRTNRS